MTHPLTFLGKLALPAAVAALSVFGLSADTSAQSNADHPIACAFLVEEGRFGPSVQGVVTAHQDVSGQFKLTFAKHGGNSANVTQTGRFALDAGETRTLGQASLGRGAVDARLELSIGGSDLVCQSAGLLDL